MNGPIPPFTEGGEDSPFSASRMNQIVALVNALATLTVKPDGAGKFVVGRSNAVLEIAAQAAATGTATVKVFKVQSGGDANDHIVCYE